jgi:hypothetical protein
MWYVNKVKEVRHQNLNTDPATVDLYVLQFQVSNFSSFITALLMAALHKRN